MPSGRSLLISRWMLLRGERSRRCSSLMLVRHHTQTLDPMERVLATTLGRALGVSKFLEQSRALR